MRKKGMQLSSSESEVFDNPHVQRSFQRLKETIRENRINIKRLFL